MNKTTQYIIFSKLQSVFDEMSFLKREVDLYKEKAMHAEQLGSMKDHVVISVSDLKINHKAVVAGHVREVSRVEFYRSGGYRAYFKDGYQCSGGSDEVIAIIK